MDSLSYKPVSPALGVEVTLDLEHELKDRRLAALHGLYDEHRLLLFRKPAALGGHAGRIRKIIRPDLPPQPGDAASRYHQRIEYRPAGVLGAGELLFHSDNTFFREPLQAIGLYGIEIPPEGGDTLFSNCQKVFEAMPPDLQRTLDGLTSYQVFDYNSRDYNRRLTLDPGARGRAPAPYTRWSG